ncbi:hypothetical protein COP2_018509 [Malus domestica]
MEDNYKFSKVSHCLDEDSVKQNQFVVPNKASPTKVSSMENNYKFSKASHYLDQDSVKQNQFVVPNKASPTKVSSMEDNYKFSKASHYLDQDSVKQNLRGTQQKLQLQSFTYKASTPKLHLRKLHP